jgi:pimeloyl-ACP methyl ester carboxylesterase
VSEPPGESRAAEPPVVVEVIRPRLDDDAVADLKERLARRRLGPPLSSSVQPPGIPSTDGAEDWSRGVTGPWLAELLSDWQAFDVAGFQTHLDGLHHHVADIDGQHIHFLHAPGSGPDPFPLLLTHGWPGSFCEYLDLLPLLTDPHAHGGDPADSFSVVVPSLPGFGFSPPPPSGGLTAPQIAELWHRLMRDGLGYARYAAHGSDLGAGVTAWLARIRPDAVAAIHLATPGLAPPPRPWSPAEEAHFAEVDAWAGEEGGYAHQHATKPATLAAALLDSPAGLAAWVGEKVTSWSATTADGQPAFPRDRLLATLTLYWTTGTIGSSLLPYWAYRHSAGTALPAGDPPPVPTAISVFGGEGVPFPKPPRELAERYFTVVAWDEHRRGGHFPAVAEPQLLAETLRDAFRPYRHRR